MKSDPTENAAWRAFGMLDADETAAFDDAAREDVELTAAAREMDRLSAAIAVSAARPVAIGTAHFDRIRRKLGMPESRSRYFWLAISGWSAAALLAAMFFLRSGATTRPEELAGWGTPLPAEDVSALGKTLPPTIAAKPTEAATTTRSGGQPAATGSSANTVHHRDETKRLVQEIETLRDQLKQVEQGELSLFQPVPGLAVPVVMRMVSPENSATLGKPDAETDAPVVALLAESFTANARRTDKETPFSETPQPAAIPIYDAARDQGTLVVSDLPALAAGQTYNLWFTTTNSSVPIHIGNLPDQAGTTGAESFDFSLGSRSVLPNGFILTRDPAGQPAAPAKANTVLQGPATEQE